jgi:EAL domain-containing protein (putative c-di-GMP-specific phosphodiesterase class I)
VNLSAMQFTPELPRLVADSARMHGLDPGLVEIEVTESMLIKSPEAARRLLQQITARGSRVVLDDFGVGYSSLGQLRRLPATALKIDRSFVSNVPDDASSASIAEAIIAMARSLGLRVVAEGVETRAQLDFLRAHRCDTFQGYLFSKPLTALEASAMLRAQASGAGGRTAA